MNIPQFFRDPVADALGMEQYRGTLYKNMLAEQAIRDQQEQRAGYEAAYSQITRPVQQESPWGEMGQKLLGPDYRADEASVQGPQPYQAPQGSSYGFIQGAEQANALMQKMQLDYHNTAIQPVLNMAVKEGNNEVLQKLVSAVNSSTNPATGLSKQILSMIQGINLQGSGKIGNVVLNDGMRQVLRGSTPTIQAGLDAVPTDSHVTAILNDNNEVTSFNIEKNADRKTNNIIRVINGVPHTIKVDALTGEDIKDMGEAKSTNLRGNAPLSADQEKAAQSYARAMREGRLASINDVPAYRGMRDRVMYLVEGGVEGETPVSYVAGKAEAKAVSASIDQLDKQYTSMGSFVRNISKQVDRVNEISSKISTFDTRLLNLPLRALKKKVAGNPNLAKYELYLAEIEGEIGKLATNSTGSVKELSESAQAKWEKIHDKNLSVKDMLELLQETKHAGEMRRDSIREELGATKARSQRVSGSGAVNPQFAAAMASEIVKRIQGKKVNTGDVIKFKWKDGSKYSATMNKNGTFDFKYIGQ